MRVPGFAYLYASLLVGRLSGQMVAIALILFVLARYHSPQLAGVTAFLAITPGLLLSPIAGALLDRYGRARLVMLDNMVAAATGLLVAGLSWILALPTPRSSGRTAIFVPAWLGLRFVAPNASLRGLALTLSTYNLSWGVLNIAVPVLVLGRLHQGPATVGLLWGAMGAGGLVSALFFGRINSRGRERHLMVGAIVVSAAAMALLPLAASLPLVVAAIVVVGVANGPFDVALFTLRQRRTDPAWFGRAFAISMSVNWIGTPIGSALAGPVIAWSLDAALWAAAIVALLSAVFPVVAIPRDTEDAQAVRERASVR